MHWIVAGLLMFISSVGVYLLIRRATLSGMPLSVQNFASFIVPLFLYIPLAVVSRTSFVVSWYQLLVLAISAVLFSYLGSRLSFLSLKYAPNPGYSLVLSKSYVVFTTLFALIFFRSVLTVQAAIAIGLIVLFSAFIMIDPKATQAKRSRPVWLPLAVGTFVCWGMLAISSKYLLDIGVPIYARLVYMMSVVSAFILADMRRERIHMSALTHEQRWLFTVIGVLFAGFNYFMQLGYQLAPNIGYINAINAASIAFVTIGATIFFRDEFSVRKFIGVIGVIAGLILLVL